MEERWLNINEIEYSYQQLSEIYNRIDNDKIMNESENLNELVKDNALVKELKENGIPYRCEWEDRLVKNETRRSKIDSHIVHHYFVNIYIPESYSDKYEKILNKYTDNEIGIEEEDSYETYALSEISMKIIKNIFKVVMFIIIVSVIYLVIKG